MAEKSSPKVFAGPTIDPRIDRGIQKIERNREHFENRVVEDAKKMTDSADPKRREARVQSDRDEEENLRHLPFHAVPHVRVRVSFGTFRRFPTPLAHDAINGCPAEQDQHDDKESDKRTDHQEVFPDNAGKKREPDPSRWVEPAERHRNVDSFPCDTSDVTFRKPYRD